MIRIVLRLLCSSNWVGRLALIVCLALVLTIGEYPSSAQIVIAQSFYGTLQLNDGSPAPLGGQSCGFPRGFF